MTTRDSEPLLIQEQRGKILSVSLNRPAKLNAMSLAMLAELLTALEFARRTDDVRVVILTGVGDKAFCAGGDLNEIRKLTQKTARAYAAKGHELTAAIENLGKPVIAAINGYALGGGLEIALACHLRIASNTAQLGLPEIRHGIIPGWGGTARIVRAVGSSRAMEICLLGEPITADQAYRIGLVHQVSEPGGLMNLARNHAESLAGASPAAVAGITDVISRAIDLTMENALILEEERFAVCCRAAEIRTKPVT